VSVLEAADALASLKQRPRRSVLFILFCGEEKGLRGSTYYAANPLVPLEYTVAHLNLEQMGRTDDARGPQIATANVTGFDFSDVTTALVESGKLVGVNVVKDAKLSAPYFARSDNAPLARMGVPAHTMSVAYDFPDYHALGDEWQKIDYNNMAKVDRAVALGVLRLASSLIPPRWNAENPAAKRYVDAAIKLHSK
jgi:Zn-dependent M28 family amino/carboxypeptidase